MQGNWPRSFPVATAFPTRREFLPGLCKGLEQILPPQPKTPVNTANLLDGGFFVALALQNVPVAVRFLSSLICAQPDVSGCRINACFAKSCFSDHMGWRQ